MSVPSVIAAWAAGYHGQWTILDDSQRCKSHLSPIVLDHGLSRHLQRADETARFGEELKSAGIVFWRESFAQ